MSNGKKKIDEGYQPEENQSGYQPEDQPPPNADPQSGYTPTRHGDDNPSDPQPPDEE